MQWLYRDNGKENGSYYLGFRGLRLSRDYQVGQSSKPLVPG